jgi:hypothetical protein
VLAQRRPQQLIVNVDVFGDPSAGQRAFNPKLADIDDFGGPAHEGVAMPPDAEWGLLQSQALLDVFEKDCGRPAATLAEVRYWASAQNSKHLQFRVKRRLLELLFGVNPNVQQQTEPRFAPPPRGWRVLRRKPKRRLPAIASVIAAMSGHFSGEIMYLGVAPRGAPGNSVVGQRASSKSRPR